MAVMASWENCFSCQLFLLREKQMLMFKMNLVSAIKESNLLSRGKNSVYIQSVWAKDASSKAAFPQLSLTQGIASCSFCFPGVLPCLQTETFLTAPLSSPLSRTEGPALGFGQFRVWSFHEWGQIQKSKTFPCSGRCYLRAAARDTFTRGRGDIVHTNPSHKLWPCHLISHGSTDGSK